MFLWMYCFISTVRHIRLNDHNRIYETQMLKFSRSESEIDAKIRDADKAQFDFLCSLLDYTIQNILWVCECVCVDG